MNPFGRFWNFVSGDEANPARALFWPLETAALVRFFDMQFDGNANGIAIFFHGWSGEKYTISLDDVPGIHAELLRTVKGLKLRMSSPDECEIVQLPGVTTRHALKEATTLVKEMKLALDHEVQAIDRRRMLPSSYITSAAD